MKPLNFSSYVVKVASRCNLNCTYCYMYQHVDQTWKNKPKCLSEIHQQLLGDRLAEYVKDKGMNRVLIVFHGGEPLLFGAENLVQFANDIRKKLSLVNCQADFGIQTNGTLLKESHLDLFLEHNISISLSIDGPKEIHDQHRVDLKNRPTFDKVYEALQLLQKYPKIFQGCIAVINPHHEPRKLFEFFDQNNVRDFNILIPDANYISPPEGRDKNPNLYKDWLIQAFDCWFDNFSHIKCKYFDWLIMSILGKPSPTDSFGLGDISMLVIETDGTYHNHDVLKITEENSSSLGLSLENNPIRDAEKAEKIQFHRTLLTKEGLSPTCQSCRHVNVCGGGFIAHRFSESGYCNPSVYCDEIYSLIDHIYFRISQKLSQSSQQQKLDLLPEFDKQHMNTFWHSKTSNELIQKLQEHAAKKSFTKLHAIIPYALNSFPSKKAIIETIKGMSFEDVKHALLEPTVVAWLRAIYGHGNQSPAFNIDRKELPADPDYFDELLQLAKKISQRDFVIQSKDRWYRLSLGPNICIEHSSKEFAAGLAVLQTALQIVQNYNPYLHNEMLTLSRNIQLVKDSSAHLDKDVSFSDETMPGAIFIGVWTSSGLISPHVVAASLIHEHFHQKLYLLMHRFELCLPQETLVYSPWPKVKRPPSGALHAVYVFTQVALYWKTMIDDGISIDTATEHLDFHLGHLESCIEEIKANVEFTTSGQLFFDCICEDFTILKERCIAKKY